MVDDTEDVKSHLLRRSSTFEVKARSSCCIPLIDCASCSHPVGAASLVIRSVLCRFVGVLVRAFSRLKCWLWSEINVSTFVVQLDAASAGYLPSAFDLPFFTKVASFSQTKRVFICACSGLPCSPSIFCSLSRWIGWVVSSILRIKVSVTILGRFSWTHHRILYVAYVHHSARFCKRRAADSPQYCRARAGKIESEKEGRWVIQNKSEG